MTEAEWLACADPGKIVAYLNKERHDRKLRLFVCACCRRVWDWFDDEASRAAVEAAERFAAGTTSKRELTRARKASGAAVARAAAARDLSKEVACELAWSTTGNSTTGARNSVWVFRGETDKQWQLSFLRDIFGNPFRPVTLDPAWRTANVVGIAQSIYEDRAFDRMPILADALEDAGCTQEALLKHCREPGEHVRGCWLVDSLLGKE